MTLYHASCVEFQGKGILILGESGTGKSDLALRLIDRGAKLVSDDYVEVNIEDDLLYASPAPNIEGLIEVRGVGLKKCEFVSKVTLRMAIETCDRDKIERLPEQACFDHEGIKIPFFKIDAFAASAIAKIKMMLK